MPNMKITVLDMMSIVRYSFPLFMFYLVCFVFVFVFVLFFKINEISFIKNSKIMNG